MAYNVIDLTVAGDINQDATDELKLTIDKIQGTTIDLSGIAEGEVLKLVSGEIVNSPETGAPAAVILQRTTVNFAASPYTVLSGDNLLGVDSTGGAVVLVLPTAVTDRVIVVKDESGTSNSNKITLDSGAETIDGTIDLDLKSKFGSLTIYGVTGTGWFVV